MKTLNHPKTHVIKPLLIAGGLATAVAASAWAAELPDVVVNSSARDAATDVALDPESVAHANWRTFMAKNSTPATGCFHASYPDVVWQRVACKTGEPRVRPGHSEPKSDAAEITGGIGEGSNDYVAMTAGLIAGAIGEFFISGVLDEVDIPIYGNQGILGPGEYSIQLNTNKFATTSACAGHSGCHVWQQFLYATDYIDRGEAEVFIQYWLLDWGTSACPTGYQSSDATNCYQNSSLVAVPDVPVTNIGNGNVVLTGTATAGGSDTVMFIYEDDAYSTSYTDSVLHISSVWDKTEFNVLGNGGGARALFNTGASITVDLIVVQDDESDAAPACLAADGSSGESNNMTVGACTASGGTLPRIYYTETN